MKCPEQKTRWSLVTLTLKRSVGIGTSPVARPDCSSYRNREQSRYASSRSSGQGKWMGSGRPPSSSNTNSDAAIRSAVVPGLRWWPTARNQESKARKRVQLSAVFGQSAAIGEADGGIDQLCVSHVQVIQDAGQRAPQRAATGSFGLRREQQDDTEIGVRSRDLTGSLNCLIDGLADWPFSVGREDGGD